MFVVCFDKKIIFSASNYFYAYIQHVCNVYAKYMIALSNTVSRVDFNVHVLLMCIPNPLLRIAQKMATKIHSLFCQKSFFTASEFFIHMFNMSLTHVNRMFYKILLDKRISNSYFIT